MSNALSLQFGRQPLNQRKRFDVMINSDDISICKIDSATRLFLFPSSPLSLPNNMLLPKLVEARNLITAGVKTNKPYRTCAIPRQPTCVKQMMNLVGRLCLVNRKYPLGSLGPLSLFSNNSCYLGAPGSLPPSDAE